MYMIFVKLVVADLARAQAFYEALGLRTEGHSSDDRTVTMIVGDTIVIELVTQDAFADLVAGHVGDPSKETTVVNCLSVGSRDEVNDFMTKAKTSGGTLLPRYDQDVATHTGAFSDPDGHVWQITYMEPVHVID